MCGGNEFAFSEVLWRELIDDWCLSPYEVSYVNRQQGFRCIGCGNNFRSMALASAILDAYSFTGNLVEFVSSEYAENLNVLEVNDAGGLSSVLANLPVHELVKYPDFDMENLAVESDIYDLVIHSDTLEHVSDPFLGLAECYRVLKPFGRCLYTVPIIVGRLSRSRKGLKNSFHGNADDKNENYIVHTEFGADSWIYPINAGFRSVRFHCFEYPAALAIEAVK